MTGSRIALPLVVLGGHGDCGACRGAARPRGATRSSPRRTIRSRSPITRVDAQLQCDGRGARDQRRARGRRCRPRQQLSRPRARAQCPGRAGACREGRGRQSRRPTAPARHVGNFAKGLVTGEPDDLVGLAGTAVGDLFVFGDIRDAVREGTRLAAGQKADELILGLACVGLAVTAGTYASLGAVLPARVGSQSSRRRARPAGSPAAWRPGSAARCARWSTSRPCQARGRQRLHLAARDGRACRARGGQGREGGRPGQAGRRCRPGAGQGRHAGRARWAQDRAGPADMAQGRDACGGERRQDPRDPQARRPQRHLADDGRVQSASGCSGRRSRLRLLCPRSSA